MKKNGLNRRSKKIGKAKKGWQGKKGVSGKGNKKPAQPKKRFKKPRHKSTTKPPSQPQQPTTQSTLTKANALLIKARNIYNTTAIAREKALMKQHANRQDQKWLNNIIQKGTWADRISSLQLKIASLKTHSLKYIQNLLQMCHEEQQKKTINAITAMQEEFLNNILPDGKLLTFFKQIEILPHNIQLTDDQLREFYWNHEIKQAFMRYLEILKKMTHENLQFHQKQAIRFLIGLLVRKAEQEKTVLAAIVGKFTDRNKEILNFIPKQLGVLLKEHNRMSIIVAQEVERVMMRQNATSNCKIHCLAFLNSIDTNILTFEDKKSLLKIYFNHFKIIIMKSTQQQEAKSKKEKLKEKRKREKEAKKSKAATSKLTLVNKNKFKNQSKDKPVQVKQSKKEMDKILGQILRGINRLFERFSKQDFQAQLFKGFFESELKGLYKMSHTLNIKTRIQILLFIFQIQKKQGGLTDRYYRVLYELVNLPEIRHSHLNEVLLDLLYSAIKLDPYQKRVKAFGKRLLQNSVNAEPTFIISILLLLSRLVKDQTCLKSMVVNPFSGNKLGQELSTTLPPDEQYDPMKREPRFANADNSIFWELLLLKRHYHPTVQVFADKILKMEELTYNGNPLLDFSLVNMLDRFSFKKAKRRQSKSSGFQKLLDKNKVRRSKTEAPITEVEMEDVRSDEQFFMKYLQSKRTRDGVKVKKVKESLGKEELWSREMQKHMDEDLNSEELLEDEDDIFEGEFDEDQLIDIDPEDGMLGMDLEGQVKGRSDFMDAEEYAQMLEKAAPVDLEARFIGGKGKKGKRRR